MKQLPRMMQRKKCSAALMAKMISLYMDMSILRQQKCQNLIILTLKKFLHLQIQLTYKQQKRTVRCRWRHRYSSLRINFLTPVFVRLRFLTVIVTLKTTRTRKKHVTIASKMTSSPLLLIRGILSDRKMQSASTQSHKANIKSSPKQQKF